jgi:predicted DNA-binding antitoxin AbrB/MazE fold protein
MSRTIHAIYENGVFKPMEAVNLPERCEVQVEVRQVTEEAKTAPMSEGLAKIYAILGERFDSGHHDTAFRHDEHQP